MNVVSRDLGGVSREILEVAGLGARYLVLDQRNPWGPKLPCAALPVQSAQQLEYLGPRPSVSSDSKGLSRQRRSLLASPSA